MSSILQFDGFQLLNVPHAKELADECITQDCYRLKGLPGRWAVADIGACYGEFAFFAKSLGHYVVAVEPSTVSHRIITLNERLSGQLDVCVNYVVRGFSAGMVKHWYRPDHPAGSGVEQSPCTMEMVPSISMARLVSILDKAQLPIFVKLDVEGAEVEIFEHLEEWIGPVSAVSMETHNFDAGKFGEQLEKHGFKVELFGTCPYPLPKWDKSMGGGLVIARKPCTKT